MRLLLLERRLLGEKSTIGRLYHNNELLCYTLEDTVRAPGVKIPGETAIPEGVYEIELKMSPRRNKLMPWLKNVTNFTAIQIHSGNDADDTEGCILVGKRYAQDVVFDSRVAFVELFAMLKIWIDGGQKVMIAVCNPITPLEVEGR